MDVWAIADLHLAFGVPEKTMEIFGPEWKDYGSVIEKNWRASVQENDIVLVAGDISWAKALHEAVIDLKWLGDLPGTKVLIKGNHDYWWSSPTKMKTVLPPSIHLIQNNAFIYHDISIGGTRLWDSQEYNFESIINYGKEMTPPSLAEKEAAEKIFNRELERLELSLKQLKQESLVRIVMTHYPPIGVNLQPSKVSALLEKYCVEHCVFGHLHSVKKGVPLFGSARGVTYTLTSSDYLEFKPIKIYSSAK